MEIGAGRGALTHLLSQRAGRLLAIEIDKSLVDNLQKSVPDNTSLVHGDFLSAPLPVQDYKVFGNLPYSQTTNIIRKLTAATNPPTDAWVVVQLEAARRFAGAPWGKESLWSLRLKPRWHIEIIDQVRPAEFDPPPRVESAMMWLARRERPLLTIDEERAYMEMIERVYRSGAAIRQAAHGLLTRTQIKRLARDLHFSESDHPSQLGFRQWLALFRFVSQAV